MKLTEQYFIPVVTDAGVAELYSFADSILHKCALSIPISQREDVRQEMIVKCLTKLGDYDASKGVPLGGYLYWQCRGAISIWANKNKHELPVSLDKIAILDAKRRHGF